MFLLGLTGGIGAGKSTVAAMLAARGAVIVDADAIVRELQRPGTDVHRRIVERFGPAVLAPDGELDRQKVAELVFRDDDARALLNAIVHPEVLRVIAERIEDLKATQSVVVLDVPLLVEAGGGEGLDLMVVVEAAEDTRVLRVVKERGLDPEQVRVRMNAQASAEQRRALADVVIVNDGERDSLEAQVEDLWKTIEERRR